MSNELATMYRAYWVCGDSHAIVALGFGEEGREEFITVFKLLPDTDITRIPNCPDCGRGPTSGRGCGWYTFTPFSFYV